MTTPHRDTETRVEGFEARLQQGFEWVNERGREFAIALGAFVLIAGIGAAVYERRSSAQEKAQAEYASIELRFAQAMGGEPGEAFVTEPANAEQAKAAREKSLAEFDQFIASHPGSRLAELATIRAAELELELGRAEPAEARLERAAESARAGDPLRGVALRLRGYSLDQRGDALAAGEAYAEGAQVEGYLARALLWLEAGDAFERAAAYDRAIASFREVLSLAPELAEQRGLVARIGLLEQKSRSAAPTVPVPAIGSDK